MAFFSRSQKMQQASIAERITAFQVEQEAESERLQRDLKEKQARERAEFEEQLKREAKALEVEEEKRQKAAERKRRELEVREVEEEMRKQKRARPLEEQQFPSEEPSGNPKRKRVLTESDVPEGIREYGGDDTGEEEEEEEPTPKGQGGGKINETGPVQWTPGMVGGQNRCLLCAEANVECCPPEGKRSLRCKRCVKHRRKCVPQKKGGNRVTTVSTAKIDKTQGMLDAAGQEMVNALRETTASLKELVEELKKCNESLIMKKETVIGLETHTVKADESKLMGVMEN